LLIAFKENRADKKILDETLHGLSLEFDKNRDNIKSISHRLKDSGHLEFYEKDTSLRFMT
jgi:hypothetical protein